MRVSEPRDVPVPSWLPTNSLCGVHARSQSRAMPAYRVILKMAAFEQHHAFKPAETLALDPGTTQSSLVASSQLGCYSPSVNTRVWIITKQHLRQNRCTVRYTRCFNSKHDITCHSMPKIRHSSTSCTVTASPVAVNASVLDAHLPAQAAAEATPVMVVAPGTAPQPQHCPLGRRVISEAVTSI